MNVLSGNFVCVWPTAVDQFIKKWDLSSRNSHVNDPVGVCRNWGAYIQTLAQEPELGLILHVFQSSSPRKMSVRLSPDIVADLLVLSCCPLPLASCFPYVKYLGYYQDEHELD